MANVSLSKERLRRLSSQVPKSSGRRTPSERFSLKETFSGVKTLSRIFLEVKAHSQIQLKKRRRKKKIANAASDILSIFLVLTNLVLGGYSIYFACKDLM
jgi:hypothetical protein